MAGLFREIYAMVPGALGPDRPGDRPDDSGKVPERETKRYLDPRKYSVWASSSGLNPVLSRFFV